MGGPDAKCLGVADIERLAADESVTPEVASHLGACAVCRAAVEEARRDATFVSRARTLTRAGLGPEGSPRIPGYQTVGVLSSAAQGTVYRARQESTSRTVAIKTLIAGDAATARQRMRAEREAEIAARLRHPNIVTVFESRTLADGRIAVVMEFVDGVPLDVWQAPGTTPGEKRLAMLRMFVEVCKAIHHAHLNGVIHRDLKPDNILVTPEGRPVVLDFGIAAAPGIRTTQTGEFAGTPAYASPEQVSGKPDGVDALTDVYSLGVLLYRLMCGAMPYELEGSLFDIARTICEAEPAPPRRRDGTIPADLEAIVLRALAKEKDRRYQSAAGLARDLERYLAGAPVEARSGSGWYLLRKAVLVNRNRLALAGAAAAMLVGTGVAVAWSMRSAAESGKRAAMEKEQARIESVRARAVTELLRAALPNADTSNTEFHWIIRSGLGQLYYKLETGAFADDPDLDQTLRRMWGSVYTDLGTGKAVALVEYAEVALRSGLTRLRMLHGKEHPEIAATLHELAGVTLVRKRAVEAEAICREALAMRERLLGAGSILTADTRALLARSLFAAGRIDEAIGEAEGALRVFRTLPDQESDLRIAAMTALEARAWIGMKDVAKSEGPTREALVRRLRRLPPDEPDLLASLADAADFMAIGRDSALGAVVAEAWGGSGAETAAAIRDDLPRFRVADGDDWCGPQLTGRTLALGRLIRLQTALLGPDDPSLLRALLAQMGAAQGENKLAVKREAALRAAEILSRRRGEMDRSVLSCIEEAAVVLVYEGRPDEAVELTRRAQRIHELAPSEVRDVLIVSNSRRHLAWYLSLAGRDREAIPEFRRVLAEMRPRLGADHHVVAMAEAGLAYCLARTGELEEADALSEHASRIALSSPLVVGDQVAHMTFARGMVLMERGQWLAATAQFEIAWERFYQCTVPTFAWRVAIVNALARCSEELGDADGAQRWRDRMDYLPPDVKRLR